MTPKEAWKNIKDDVDFLNLIDNGNYSTDDDIKIIDEIVAKAEPMKPIKTTSPLGEKKWYYLTCPTCKIPLHYHYKLRRETGNYCKNCGQKLDRSDEE